MIRACNAKSVAIGDWRVEPSKLGTFRGATPKKGDSGPDEVKIRSKAGLGEMFAGGSGPEG